MKNFQISISLIGSLLLILMNTWVTIALGLILAGMRLMVQLILKNQIRVDRAELLKKDSKVFGMLSKFVLWDRLQFDTTKVLLSGIKNGDEFLTLIALLAGADVELGMMANAKGSVLNQETIKSILINFGGTPIRDADQEAIFVNELDLDSYDQIDDLTLDFFISEGIIDEECQPVKIDQNKGVFLALERFGVRKVESSEMTLSQNRAEVKTDIEIDEEIRTFLSKFSSHEAIRNEKLTFFSKAQRVPCINPLCRYGKVICPNCNGEKKVICDRCDGTGLSNLFLEKTMPAKELISCQECDGTGNLPGQIIEVDCECSEQTDCMVCGGKGIIKEDYCHNCEGTGKVCILCGGTGIREIIEKGPVCKTCEGTGMIESQQPVVEYSKTECKQCEGSGKISCKSCFGTGNIACESCEGHGHMFSNVRLDVVLDKYPSDKYSSFIQFDDEDMDRLFGSDKVEILKGLRAIDTIKIYRHEDRMVGKLFHNPTNKLLASVNNFLSEIEVPYSQIYERVELIVGRYHFVTFQYENGNNKSILFLNDNEISSR